MGKANSFHSKWLIIIPAMCRKNMLVVNIHVCIGKYNHNVFHRTKLKNNTNYSDFNLILLLLVCLHLVRIFDCLFKVLLFSAVSITVFGIVYKSHFLVPHLYFEALASMFYAMLT